MIKNQKKNARGFTLIELMIVVAIIGILAAIAVPNFLRYQLRAKSGEAAVNLAAIKTSQVAFYGNNDTYIGAATRNPLAATAIGNKVAFTPPVVNDGWFELGWRPEGAVYFSYGVPVANNATSGSLAMMTADAIADLDGDTTFQCWAVQVPQSANAANVVAADAACTPVAARISSVHKAGADGNY